MDDLWLAADDASHATKGEYFGLSISKSSTHWKPSWEDAVRTHEWVFLLFWFVIFRARLHLNLVDLRSRHPVLEDRLSLVNIASIGNDAVEFTRIRRLVVVRNLFDLRGCFDLNYSTLLDRLSLRWWKGGVLRHRRDGSRVAHVYNKYVFVDNKYSDAAGAWLIVGSTSFPWVSHLQEILVGFIDTLPNGFFNVPGELWLHDNVIVKDVFQVLCALASSMPVIHSEDL